MKKTQIHKLISTAALAALATSASQAMAQILYEPFNHPQGSVLDASAADANKNYTTSGTYWNKRGSQTGDFTIQPGLTGPTAPGVILPPNFGGTAEYNTSGTNGRTPNIGFGQTITSGDVYYSLQLKLPTGTLPATAGAFAGLTNFAIPGPSSIGLFQTALRYQRDTTDTSRYQIGIQGPANATAQFAPGTYSGDDTLFLVARLRIVDGLANDQIDFWVNPTTGFGGDPSQIPAGSVTTITNNQDSIDATPAANPMIAGFFMRSYSATAGFKIDELRVDSTWAGVTPDGTKQYGFNNAGGGNWSGNWNDYQGVPTANNPSALGDVANFGTNIASGSTINVDAPKTLDTINLTNAGSLTISGQPLTFSSNASAGQVYVYGGDHAINSPITMSSNVSIKTAAGAAVTLGGAVSGAGKTLGVYGRGIVRLAASNLIDDAARLEVRSGTLDLGANSETVAVLQLGTSHPNPGVALAANTPYNGDLASGTISGTGVITANAYDLQSGTIAAGLAGGNGVVKNLSGFVTLSGNNSYTGDTIVNSGILTLAGTNSNPVVAIVNPPPAVSGATATLALNSDAGLGAAGASVTISATTGFSGTLAFNEDMTLASDRVINANADLSRLSVASGKTATFGGAVGGTGGVIKVGDGTLVLNGATTYVGATSVTAGTLVLGQSLTTTSGMTISGTSTLRLAPAQTSVLKTPTLAITGTGRLDLTDNKLITNEPAGTATANVYSGIQGLVQTGRAGGAWTGAPGIITSLPTNNDLTTIGVATGAQIDAALAADPNATALFAGQTINGASTIAMYTYGGDANLDGLVSGDDYTAIDFAIATPGASGWVNGDFNYDGFISGDDYTIIDFNIVAQGTAFPTGSSAGGAGLAGVTAVPEPASLSIIALAAARMLGRRRRRSLCANA